MNAKPKTELNRCVFVQKRNSVNGALDQIFRITGNTIIFYDIGTGFFHMKVILHIIRIKKSIK